jgi:hypothetical protein
LIAIAQIENDERYNKMMKLAPELEKCKPHVPAYWHETGTLKDEKVFTAMCELDRVRVCTILKQIILMHYLHIYYFKFILLFLSIYLHKDIIPLLVVFSLLITSRYSISRVVGGGCWRSHAKTSREKIVSTPNWSGFKQTILQNFSQPLRGILNDQKRVRNGPSGS